MPLQSKGKKYMLCREHREAIADLKQANRKEIRDRMEDADVVHADRIAKLKARIERTRVKSEAVPLLFPPPKLHPRLFRALPRRALCRA